MDKQERDRLRSKCNAILDAAKRNEGWAWRQGISELREDMSADGLLALLDHIDALEGKVKAAFDEGYEFGHDDGYRDLITGPEPCWNRSNAKAALTQAEEKGK